VNKAVSLLRLVSVAALALPVLAHAAGLGRLTVQSFLGQPLRAEIEIVSLQPGEEASLEARLASGNAFAQAGIEFNAALNTMRFAVEKRGGRPVILMTTRQPVNEPFIDVLVELRWSTGLFVREYTLLLDPPGYEGPKPQPTAAAPDRPAAVESTPSAGAAERAPPAPTTSQISPAPRVEERPMETAATPAAKPEAPETPKPAPAEGAAPSSAPAPPPGATAAVSAPQGPQTYEVKKGDTLGEIALRYRPAGVSYHQMLIALQRANEEAFIRDNINLVRAGRILTIPDADAAAAVDPADANRLVFAQHADFAEYRSSLASAVASAPSAPKPAEQSAAGPITVQPESPKPAAPADQLKLSRKDPKKPGAAATKSAREDDVAARQRALEEAQSRVADLEKNVADLSKLLEIRNQQLAQLQEKAAAKPAAAVPQPPKPAAEAPKPAVAAPQAPKPAAEAPKPAAAAPAAPKPAAEAPKPAAAAPEAPKPAAEPPKPVAEAPKPPAAAPAKPKPKPRPIAPPPPEPSFLDEFLDDPTLALGGIGLVVALLGGYGYWAWQRKKKSVAKFKDSVLGSASLAPLVGADAAAGPVSVSQTSVTQSTAGGVDADDVDPIAEADVYMAYGRDAQAEEILKEALQRDPNRLAVHAKLLEIYANRRDAQAFEQAALKLKGATGGAGPEWDKAMAMGRSIDPGNGLYGGAGETTPTPVPAFAAAAAAAPAVDFDIGGGGAAEPAGAAAPMVDLDISGPASAPQERSDFSPSGTLIIDNEDTNAAASGLDFDLGGSDEKAPEAGGGGLNFELPGAAPGLSEAAAAAPDESAPSTGGLDFDLNLGGGGESKEASPPALDLSAISLDLDTPGETPAASGGNGNGGDPKWQEVATKLDLAKAYEEMGDKDGARELLNEVLREGDSAQQGQANQLLARLG